MRRGIATFTLDTGRCPRWLFERMVRLGREMTRVLVEEYGPDEFVRRISDPVWFQSLGTVLAFDWNASGLTTILTAALKEAIREREKEWGIFICGGKGKTSRKTPEEIMHWGERLLLPEPHTQNLIYNSRMSAKVDSALVQDGFQLYHHSFFFALSKAKRPERAERVEGYAPRQNSGQTTHSVVWAVVQQGMNANVGAARRYHWFSENINDLVCEPHSGILSQVKEERMLNLVAKESEKTREVSTELAQSGFKTLMKDIEILRKHSSPLSQMVSLRRYGEQLTLLNLEDVEFRHHPVVGEDFSRSKYLEKILTKVTYEKPENYEKLLATEGVGPKTMRALALVSEVIYGAKPSYEDPARYSFAHGGKDATPYPVDRETYDKSIAILQKAVEKSRIERREKDKALRRVASLQFS